jgi:hypothetical protein
MKIRAYSPQTGNLVADDITGINFGIVRQGQHGVLPVCIRPVKDTEDISGIELYLQNNGGFSSSEYGYFHSSEFIPGVQSDSPGFTGSFLSDHFSVVSNPPFVTGGVNLGLNTSGEGDYVWLDVQAGSLESGSTSTVNYRFMFEYS